MVQPENSGDRKHGGDADLNTAELITRLGKLAGYGITAHFYGRKLGGTIPNEINNDFLITMGEGLIAVWGTCSAVNEGLKRLGDYRERKFLQRIDEIERDLNYDSIEGHPDYRDWHESDGDEPTT